MPTTFMQSVPRGDRMENAIGATAAAWIFARRQAGPPRAKRIFARENAFVRAQKTVSRARNVTFRRGISPICVISGILVTGGKVALLPR